MVRLLAIVILSSVLTVASIACSAPDEAQAPGPTVQPRTQTVPASTSVPISTVVPKQPDFEISLSRASVQLPDSIVFRLEGEGDRPVEYVDVEFGTAPIFSCASSEYQSARTKTGGTREVSVTKEWEMRRTGSIPPGATVWWRWRVVDDLGQEFLSPKKEVIYNDDRFDWHMHSSDNITFNWYAGGSGFGRRLAESVSNGLANLQVGRDLTAPAQAFVYESSEDLRGAVLFTQSWTGGLAFISHNILLIAVEPQEYETYIPGLIHELAHLLVNDLTFNCFGDLPTWLEEGLATYAEGDLTDYQRTALEEAISNDGLISLRSLNSSFPVDHSGAYLSYAQSWSLVNYLIEEYGWPKMRQLLDVFSDGATYEQAIERVYRMGLDELQAVWFQSLGARSP